MSSSGRIASQELKSLIVGMEQAEVRSLLGNPDKVMTADEMNTPSQAFESLGSEFRFPDWNLDSVWRYIHATNDRRQFYLGFKDGRLVTTWKMSRSEP